MVLFQYLPLEWYLAIVKIDLILQPQPHIGADLIGMMFTLHRRGFKMGPFQIRGGVKAAKITSNSQMCPK